MEKMQHGEQELSARKRSDYEAPRMTVLGSLEELTLEGVGGTAEGLNGESELPVTLP